MTLHAFLDITRRGLDMSMYMLAAALHLHGQGAHMLDFATDASTSAVLDSQDYCSACLHLLELAALKSPSRP